MFGRLLGCYTIYTFSGAVACPVTEFYQVQNVQVLCSVLAALLHGTRVVGVSQTLQGMELPNFRRRRHLYLAGRRSRWASAHILVDKVLLASWCSCDRWQAGASAMKWLIDAEYWPAWSMRTDGDSYACTQVTCVSRRCVPRHAGLARWWRDVTALLVYLVITRWLAVKIATRPRSRRSVGDVPAEQRCC